MGYVFLPGGGVYVRQSAVGGLCLAYVVGNPVSDFLRAKPLPSLDLNLGCAYASVERGIDSPSDTPGFLLTVEMLEEHGHGQYLGEGIRYIHPRRLRP